MEPSEPGPRVETHAPLPRRARLFRSGGEIVAPDLTSEQRGEHRREEGE